MSFFFQVVQELGETFNNIVGDVLLSAGIVAYLGPFTVEFRQVNAGKTLFKQRLFLRIFLCDNLYNVLFSVRGAIVLHSQNVLASIDGPILLPLTLKMQQKNFEIFVERIIRPRCNANKFSSISVLK